MKTTILETFAEISTNATFGFIRGLMYFRSTKKAFIDLVNKTYKVGAANHNKYSEALENNADTNDYMYELLELFKKKERFFYRHLKKSLDTYEEEHQELLHYLNNYKIQ